MTVTETIILFAGLFAGGALISMLVWSIMCPARRVWPPDNFNMKTPVVAWLLTVGIFVSAIALGAFGWGSLELPMWLRWGVGLPFVIAGNLVVWWGVHRIGMDATSGAEAELITTGIYSVSRNPQYVADICILIGIGLLSAALWVWPIIAIGAVALILAAFEAYCSTTRRFL